MLTKKYWVLISLIIILGGGVLVYFGPAKQESGLIKPHSEQTKSGPIKQLIIPSSLEPYEAMAQFVPYMPPWGDAVTEAEYWQYFEITPNDGFGKGFGTVWQGKAYWIKKNGAKVYGVDDPDNFNFILELMVLKYEKLESAKEDHDKINAKQGFGDIILEGVKLKTKVGIPPVIEGWIKEYDMELEPEQCEQYLLHSANFIIYAVGLKEAAEDVILRVIDRYKAE